MSEEQQQQLHVLAVDDSIIDRKVIERLLKISSCKVTTVDSGKRALQYLGLLDGGGNSDSDNNNGLKVNLIITDYWMPGMTGFELLKKIKESSSNCREIPVVIMSSENVLPWINRCLEEGAEEFLVKPVQLSDVRRLKNNHIKRDDGDEQFQGKKSASTAAVVSTAPAVATTAGTTTTSGTTTTTTTNKRKLEEDSSRGVYISSSSLELRESPARRLRPLDEVEAI